MYEAILFDMDGVVIDTHHAVTEFWHRIANRHKVELTQKDFEQHIYGCLPGHTLDIVFPFLNTDERQAMFTELVIYEANLTYQPVDGTLELLHSLKQHNIPAALVTSGDRAKVKEVAGQLELDGLFGVKVTAEDVEQGKPYPDCYLKAAQSLKKSPQQCIVFEDAISGIKAASTAGAFCIGVQQSKNLAAQLLSNGAKHIVPNLGKVRVQTEQDNGSGSIKLQIDAENSLPLNANPQH